MNGLTKRSRVSGTAAHGSGGPAAGMCAATSVATRWRFLTRVGFVGLLLTTLGCGRTEPQSEPEAEDLAKAVYAAPGGWSGGEGTKASPYDLKTALSEKSAIQPGGTVWLRGGTYRVSAVTSVLAGTEQAPITVRQFPGEYAVIDGAQAVGSALTVNGAWTVYRDFEMTNSDPRRSGPELNRAGAINVRGANVKLVNLVVHDFASGIGMGADTVDVEAYGNIIYYNGDPRPDGAQGHGIFGQNKTGVRRINDNVVFGQFGSGIRAYASDEGFLDDIQLEGNIASNNSDYSILLGGHSIAKRPVLKANYVYDNSGMGINLGYGIGCADAVMRDNYFSTVRGYAIQLVNCSGELQGNVFIGKARGIDGKTIVTQPELALRYPGSDFAAPPTVTKTFVRPNRYQPGRAHVIVYNWEHTKEVSVDLTSVALPAGAAYELRDVRNLAAGPVASGTYSSGAVTIPLEGLTAAPVIGWEPTPPHTAPEFAVFLLTSSSDAAATTSLFTRLKRRVGL